MRDGGMHSRFAELRGARACPSLATPLLPRPLLPRPLLPPLWRLSRQQPLLSPRRPATGPEKLLFSLLRAVYEARVFIVFAALGSFVLATGGKRAPGFGAGAAATAVWHEDDDAAADDFDEFDD